MCTPVARPSLGSAAEHLTTRNGVSSITQHKPYPCTQLEECFTTAPGEAVQLAADAVAAGVAAVLAVGGDGTIHEVKRSSSSSSSSGQ
jgi:diacylglycerol kinase family enzyme